MLGDLFLIAIILVIIGAAVAYIVKEKKRGAKCVGCPYAKNCASKGNCGGERS